jgi:hypothetical protein
MDMSLLKINNAIHPITYILGDVWGKKYPQEKRMLDAMIHALKEKKFTKGHADYLIPFDQIKSAKGLSIDIKSDLITENERILVENILSLTGVSVEPKSIHLNQLNSLQDIMNLVTYIGNRQKEVKSMKELVKGIVSDRVTSCYAPYTGKAREKVRKQPIRELREKIKGTDHFRAFNPTRWVSCLGVAPLPHTITNFNDDGRITARDQEFLTALIAKGLPSDVCDLVLVEYKQYLRESFGT